MPNICVAGGCNNNSDGQFSLHTFPKSPKRRNAWDRFVHIKRKEWPGADNLPNARLCSAHFVDCDFTNLGMFKQKLSRKLLLKPGAVPSRLAISDSSESVMETSTSVHTDSSNRIPTDGEAPPAFQALFDDSKSHNSMNTEPTTRGNSAAARKRLVQRLMQDTYSQGSNAQQELDDIEIPVTTDMSYHTDIGIQTSCGTHTNNKATQCNTVPILPRKSRSIATQTPKYDSSKAKQSDKGVTCHLLDEKLTFSAPLHTSTPCKKPRLDETFESFHENSKDYEDDPTYDPELDKSIMEHSNCEFDGEHREEKFIVFKSCLWELFKECPSCNRFCLVEISSRSGTMVEITRNCYFCDSRYNWRSQPLIGHIAAGNLQLSAAILFSGISQTKSLRMLQFLGVHTFSPQTFRNHAQQFLYPTIFHVSLLQQRDILKELSDMGGGLQLACDGRADSPGHSAKFGSYTVMETRINKVIHQELVQSNEVSSSNAMEKEGCLRALAFLATCGLPIDIIVSDRHPQIQKLLREKTTATHYFDGWHVTKGVKRKLLGIANDRECESLRPWIRSITNHLYWSAASSSGVGSEAVAKWTSVMEHVQNKHELCYHPPLQEHQRKKKWIKPTSAAAVKLESLVTNKRLLKDVAKMSPGIQTSDVEGFHSLIIQFAPKSVAYSYKGMLARLLLAAIHYNSNSHRKQRINSKGELEFTVRYPKFKKGEFSVLKVKESPSYDYVSQLMDVLFTDGITNDEQMIKKWNQIEAPPPLNAEFNHPDKSQAVQMYTSRFKTGSEASASGVIVQS